MTHTPTRFYAQVTRRQQNGMSMFDSPEYRDTYAAAESTALASIPAGDARFDVSATINEWDYTNDRILRFWVYDHATGRFGEPMLAFPASPAESTEAQQ